jgi:ABC-type arginine transport system ATPase subunit
LSAALHSGDTMSLLGHSIRGFCLLFVLISGRLLGTGLAGHVSITNRAFSLSRCNSELNASVALIFEGAVHLPTLLLLVWLDFSLC